MKRLVFQLACTATALVIAVVPVPGSALVPIVAMLGKQLVQQALTSIVKDALLNSLRDSGCKGAALANAISAVESRSPTALLGGMPGAASGAGLGASAIAAMGGGSMLPRLATQLPPGTSLDPEQAAMMAAMQQAMAAPMAPAQTLETIDELARLGLLPASLQQEIRECMTLFPQAAQALGMGMGMLAPVLPRLRQAREEMHALSPDEQDEFAGVIADELKSVDATERDEFVRQLGGGFFPPRVVEGVRARLR